MSRLLRRHVGNESESTLGTNLQVPYAAPQEGPRTLRTTGSLQRNLINRVNPSRKMDCRYCGAHGEDRSSKFLKESKMEARVNAHTRHSIHMEGSPKPSALANVQTVHETGPATDVEEL